MNVRAQIFESLLQSAMKDCPHSILDTTGISVGTSSMRSVVAQTRPRVGELYGLLICDALVLDRLHPFIEPGGSAIVFVPPGQHHTLHRPGLRLEAVAQARCAAGSWVWLRRSLALGALPRVSVVVVTDNDPVVLAQLLDQLRHEPTDPTWELVVVDRGSFDGTAALLETLNGDFQHVRVPRGTDARAALMAGLRIAHGEFLVPLDLRLQLNSGFACSLAAYADRGVESSSRVIQGHVEARGNAQMPQLLALHRTYLPESVHGLEALLRQPKREALIGFRARPAPSGQVRDLVAHG